MREYQGQELEKYFTPSRLNHSIEVAKVSRLLATNWGEDGDVAFKAGLLHDIAKSFTPESLRQFLEVKITYESKLYDQYPRIWHAFVAPRIIKKKFNLKIPQLLDAVKWHTTGRANMTKMDQIVYVSDFIEPGRKREHQDYIKKLAEEDLEQATYAVCLSSLQYLVSKGLIIHPYTLQCRDWLLTILTQQSSRKIMANITKGQPK